MNDAPLKFETLIHDGQRPDVNHEGGFSSSSSFGSLSSDSSSLSSESSPFTNSESMSSSLSSGSSSSESMSSSSGSGSSPARGFDSSDSSDHPMRRMMMNHNANNRKGFIKNIVRDLGLGSIVLTIQENRNEINLLVTDETIIKLGSHKGEEEDLEPFQTILFKEGKRSVLLDIDIIGGVTEGQVLSHGKSSLTIENKKKS